MVQKSTEYLKKIVIDTIVWKLSTKDALEYIEKIGKKRISERYYFKIKKQVLSDNEVTNWMNNYMGYGFLLTHKMDIEEMYRIKNPLLEIYYNETSKPYLIPDSNNGEKSKKSTMIRNPDYDVNLIMKLAPQLIEFSKLLADMHAASPLVNAVQQKMKSHNL